MLVEYVTLKVGELIQEGDLIYVPSEQHYETVGKARFGMAVAPGSVCMRPVTGLAANSHFDRHELVEIEEDQPTPREVDNPQHSFSAETELERKAWELYCRLDVDEEGAFRQAEKFITERDRRRKESGK